jgi:hypothetical protein
MSNPIIINGKAYNSLDDMPSDVRASYEVMQNVLADKNQNGVPDIMEGAAVMQNATIIYEGKAYASVNDLPPEGRAKYEQAMAKLADANQNGAQQPMIVTTQFNTTSDMNVAPTRAAAPTAPTQNLGPVIVLGVIAIVLAIVIAILLWLLLTKAR